MASSPHTFDDMLEANGGAIAPSLFPQLTTPQFETYLAVQLDAGTARVAPYAASMSVADQDAAVIAWAYYLTFLSIWTRLCASPATAKVDGEAERVYLPVQIQAFKDLAEMYEQRFLAMLPPLDGAAGGLVVLTGVPTRFRY
jgi:hypothetical protein